MGNSKQQPDAQRDSEISQGSPERKLCDAQRSKEREVILSPSASKAYHKLDSQIQKHLDSIFAKLKVNDCESPLKGELSGFYSVHFFSNKYRVIYTKVQAKLIILIVIIGKRTDTFYETATDMITQTYHTVHQWLIQKENRK